jgi:moderate conductance mechanosensitive channel
MNQSEGGAPVYSMLYSPGESLMSSLAGLLHDNTASTILQLLAILLIALALDRFLRLLSERLVHPASGQSRAEQAREQRTKALATAAYGAASKVVWLVAILTVLGKIGISPAPALAFLVVVGLAVGIGAQDLVSDVISGYHIVLEDQYAVGDTVQIGETLGRVEQLSLRRTVVRDSRGAQVTIANGKIRTVANLSRDWSQAFVDVALAPEIPLEKPLAAVEAAAAELRTDSAWSQALVDGPRVLGVHAYDRNASVARVQMRTLPMRHEEISRELRRRIQLAFQREGIPLSSVLRLELTNPQPPVAATSSAAPHSN